MERPIASDPDPEPQLWLLVLSPKRLGSAQFPELLRILDHLGEEAKKDGMAPQAIRVK